MPVLGTASRRLPPLLVLATLLPGLEWNGPRSPCRLNPTRHGMTLKPSNVYT
ncbi:hypothetical protein PspLS_08951 [Pyricularia sp. CBS 133598]|nr:hypothetical protein PspLS_08951 [Pyricularia sp. CBS 133598]